MKRSSLFYLCSAILLVIFSFTISGCKTTTEEVVIPYDYSFNIGSISYEYEITVNMESMAANLVFKQDNVTVKENYYFSLSKLTDSLYKFSYNDNLYFTGSLNDDHTFSPVYINGNIEDFIFGYEFYAGNYVLSNGEGTINVTLNLDGTALAGDDVAIFHPWRGNSVILSDEDSKENVVLLIDLSASTMEISGYTTAEINYIFGGQKYYLDTASVYDTDITNTELVVDVSSSDAYFIGNISSSGKIYTLIYFGTVEKEGNKTILTYQENKSLNFKVGDYYFDFYYTEYTSGNDFLKVYPDLELVSYNYMKADLVSISDTEVAIQTFSDDETPVKVTRFINLDTLVIEKLYWGEYIAGSSGHTYTNSAGAEITVINDNTLYYLSTDTTYALKTYYVSGYTRDTFDANMINLTGFFEGSCYYLYKDECFSVQTSPIFNDAQSIIAYPKPPYYYVENSSSSTINALYMSENESRGVIINYSTFDGYISATTYEYGDLSRVEDVYTLSTDEGYYTITLDSGNIISIVYTDTE